MNVNLGAAAAMTFDLVTGTAYWGDSAPSLASGGSNALYTLDVATGVATLIGPTGDVNGLSGLAVVGVFEPSSLLLVCFSYLLVRAKRVAG